MLYSPSTTQHNFFFLNSDFCEIPGRWWTMYFENEFLYKKKLIWLENDIRIYCCTRLVQLSTTFCFSKFLFLWNSGSVMDYVFRKWIDIDIFKELKKSPKFWYTLIFGGLIFKKEGCFSRHRGGFWTLVLGGT